MSSISVNVRFSAQEKNVFHFRERSFLRCKKKNVFHFRERSFLQCEKKMSSISANVRFYGARKKMSSISVNARMKKAAESLGGIIFSSVAVVKKLHSAGNNVKCTVKLLLLKYEGGNGDGIS